MLKLSGKPVLLMPNWLTQACEINNIYVIEHKLASLELFFAEIADLV